MTKTLVDCGNCGPDFNSIRKLAMSNFDVAVIQTHGAEDTLEVLKSRKVDLVTVNRKLDRDYTDGMEVIKQLKSDDQTAGVPRHVGHQLRRASGRRDQGRRRSWVWKAGDR